MTIEKLVKTPQYERIIERIGLTPTNYSSHRANQPDAKHAPELILFRPSYNAQLDYTSFDLKKTAEKYFEAAIR